MKRQATIYILALALVAAMTSSAGAQDWSVKGNYAGSCSCNPSCPCLFGSAPTHHHCESNSLVEIKKGHYGDVRLDGISVVITGRGGEWVKYFVSENASDKQLRAVKAIMPALFELSGDTEILALEKAPVSIERSKSKLKFAVPASVVEIEMMKGRDGKPIKIQNLSLPYAIDHTQYKSITNWHEGEDKSFSYSGTNGFTAKVEASSKD